MFIFFTLPRFLVLFWYNSRGGVCFCFCMWVVLYLVLSSLYVGAALPKGRWPLASRYHITAFWVGLHYAMLLIYAHGYPIKVVSWNVRILNRKFKRASVFQYLKQARPHAVLLQESHLDGSRILALRRPWIHKAFHATFSTFARGVSILISKSVPCTVHRVISDPGGAICGLGPGHLFL